MNGWGNKALSWHPTFKMDWYNINGYSVQLKDDGDYSCDCKFGSLYRFLPRFKGKWCRHALLAKFKKEAKEHDTTGQVSDLETKNGDKDETV